MTWVFHLGAAGVPVSWLVYGTYMHSYGVALSAARGWYERTGEDSLMCLPRLERPAGDGQFVIEVEQNGSIIRSDLFFDAEYHKHRQSPDDANWLVQFHTLKFEVPELVKEGVIEGLRTALIEADYLIPRPIWEDRYPDDAAMARMFRDGWSLTHDH